MQNPDHLLNEITALTVSNIFCFFLLDKMFYLPGCVVLIKRRLLCWKPYKTSI